ncbi:hypothetical protein D3C85_1832420 [compost metagenome]
MGVEGTEGQRFGCGGRFRPLLAHRLAAEFAARPEIDCKGEGGAGQQKQPDQQQQGEIDASHGQGFC